MEDFDRIRSKALNYLDFMISGIKNDREFYECDIGYEYTPFEETMKDYCDSYADYYIANNEAEEFFNSLKTVVETIVECNADMYYEDFFRPTELITYYIGKLISSDEDLNETVYEWMIDFCNEYDGDMIVKDYFKPFINGKKIYQADTYYTGYKDYNKMIKVFK